MSDLRLPNDSALFIGKSADGVRRVYGHGPTQDVAETECQRAAIEYVGRRPDTGPLDSWTFEVVS